MGRSKKYPICEKVHKNKGKPSAQKRKLILSLSLYLAATIHNIGIRMPFKKTVPQKSRP
jgi:hypothetical protein